MIAKLKKFFEKSEKPASSEVFNSEPPQVLKKRKKTPEKSDFMGDFSLEKFQKKEKQIKESEISLHSPSPRPMVMTSENKEKLRSSITIMLDFPVERLDLQFVGNSRINGKPIYMYTGKDFSTFDLPYEEMMSIESYAPPTDQKLVTKYVEYLADQMEKNISYYTEYVAESLNPFLPSR